MRGHVPSVCTQVEGGGCRGHRPGGGQVRESEHAGGQGRSGQDSAGIWGLQWFNMTSGAVETNFGEHATLGAEGVLPRE